MITGQTKLLSKNNLKLFTFPVGDYACNCSIIYSEQSKEALIIDPGNDHQTVLSEIKRLSLKPKKLLHTHAHFDHIGRSTEVAKETSAVICLHKADQFLYDALPAQGMFFRQNVGTPQPIDHYIEDGETFGINDPSLENFLKTIHTPGHTPGSCSFYTDYFDEPVLFSGDTLFQNSIGRTDLPGGNSQLIIKSIKDRLLRLPEETKVVTGHGPSTKILEEKRHNPFLCH